MQETLKPAMSLKAQRIDHACALIADGRVCGATARLSVGRLSPKVADGGALAPEAADGGTLAPVRSGDPIETDILIARGGRPDPAGAAHMGDHARARRARPRARLALPAAMNAGGGGRGRRSGIADLARTGPMIACQSAGAPPTAPPSAADEDRPMPQRPPARMPPAWMAPAWTNS